MSERCKDEVEHLEVKYVSIFFLQGEDVSAAPDAVESPIDTDSTEPTEVTFLNCFAQYKETGGYLYEGSFHFLWELARI